MKKEQKVVTKQHLVNLVAKKFDNQIHKAHIHALISIFVEEFVLDLQQREINIPNFCKFKIEKSKPRKFYNLYKKRFAVSKGNRLLKIKLSDSLRNEIVKNIDIIKTFL